MNDSGYATEIAASWRSVTAMAMLGTERQGAAPLAISGPIGDIIRQSQGASIERNLLLAAAALTLYRRAGSWPSPLAESPPEPCPINDLPRCPPKAARTLAAILEGQHGDVLPEWLRRARSAGLRVTEDTLPALLEAGHNHNDLADAITAVAGERGRWLASQNPEWEYAAVRAAGDPGQAQALWQTGSGTSRRTLLRRLRQTDPRAARELLESTLAEEGAEVRAELIGMLRTGLGADDEPFLESVLDDRSREVRQAAAELLATLPDSRLVRRMVERVRSLLALRHGRLPEEAQVLVTLPERCDPAMIRDAVDVKRRRPESTGQRAGWLLQIVSAVPPPFWSREWKMSPSDILQAAGRNDEWRNVLVHCWAQAAGNHGDREWASAILHADWALPVLDPDTDKPRLLGVLPAAQAEAFLVEQLQTGAASPAMELVLSYTRPWSEELTRAVLRVLQHYPGDLGLPWQAPGQTRHMALLMDPGLAGEASQLLGKSAERGSMWERMVESLLQLLEFRQNMIKEMTP